MMALYYSFNISRWSAKMPAEPQRISHQIWGDIYEGHMYRRETEVNEGTHIYMQQDRWRSAVVEAEVMTKAEADQTSALLFAYIDDELNKINVLSKKAVQVFEIYKRTVIKTFAKCGFTMEVSRCFPGDKFRVRI
ncbi:hypothetical protein VNO77_20109 [Canavalia gladiata]|uniref:Uncharacterized protein n=1 Tax=Canavalia gladiata TaxID=3824 RepID=A0AAN9QM44_CANGL